MSQSVVVRLPGREYEIKTGPGLIQQAGALLGGLGRRGRIMLVTNPTVARWYRKPLQDSLTRAGFTVIDAEVPDAEDAKSLLQAGELYGRAAEAGLDRSDAVVSLGGGVVGDLAGFVAATYLRGLAFVQVPTTLLAQIDSSIGGKVAVNLPAGKNLVGAFHQPILVLSDTETLRTLPDREMRAGLIELLKHGLLEADYFSWCERNLDGLLAGDGEVLAEGIAGSCLIKAAIVAADEREQGIRALLNLGHTVGHAVEVTAGYGVWRHGEAVGFGLLVAGRLSHRLGALPIGDLGRLERVIRTVLGDRLPRIVPGQIEGILQALSRDKKVLHGVLRFVLLDGLGRARVETSVTPEMVRQELAGLVEGEV